MNRLDFVRSNVAVLVQIVPCQERLEPMNHPVFVSSQRFLDCDDAVSGGFAIRDRIEVRQEPCLHFFQQDLPGMHELDRRDGAVFIRIEIRCWMGLFPFDLFRGIGRGAAAGDGWFDRSVVLCVDG